MSENGTCPCLFLPSCLPLFGDGRGGDLLGVWPSIAHHFAFSWPLDSMEDFVGLLRLHNQGGGPWGQHTIRMPCPRPIPNRSDSWPYAGSKPRDSKDIGRSRLFPFEEEDDRGLVSE